MRRLIFPENPNNSMIPPVKLILSGEVYYLSTTRQMFIKAIGQRALNDIRGDLIFFLIFKPYTSGVFKHHQ